MIKLTQAAVKKIKNLIEKENKGKFLRIGVQGGSCAGFSYVLRFEQEQKENDLTFEQDGIIILCDPKSHKLVDGLELDFSNNLMNSGFKFNNPNSKKECGCGASFST